MYVGDTITLTQTAANGFAFEKWVKGTAWTEAEVTGGVYTITEADGDVGNVTFSAGYMLQVTVNAVTDLKLNNAHGGSVKVKADAEAADTSTAKWQYTTEEEKNTTVQFVL